MADPWKTNSLQTNRMGDEEERKKQRVVAFWLGRVSGGRVGCMVAFVVAVSLGPPICGVVVGFGEGIVKLCRGVLGRVSTGRVVGLGV